MIALKAVFLTFDALLGLMILMLAIMLFYLPVTAPTYVSYNQYSYAQSIADVLDVYVLPNFFTNSSIASDFLAHLPSDTCLAVQIYNRKHELVGGFSSVNCNIDKGTTLWRLFMYDDKVYMAKIRVKTV